MKTKTTTAALKATQEMPAFELAYLRHYAQMAPAPAHLYQAGDARDNDLTVEIPAFSPDMMALRAVAA